MLFWPKSADFLQKNADISKIKRDLVLNIDLVYFLKLHMDVYLRATFEVSSLILTSFRKEKGRGVG